MIRVTCTECGKTLNAPDGAAGKSGKCPKCGTKIKIPVLMSAEATSEQSCVAPPSPIVPPVAPTPKIDVSIRGPIEVKSKSVNGLGVAATVMGIIAALGCWMPFFNIISIMIAFLGGLFGVIGLLTALIGRRSRLDFPIAGLVVCGISLFIAFSVTSAAVVVVGKGAEEAGKAMEQAFDEAARKELQELQAGKREAEQAQAQLQKFQVLKSRFYFREQQFMGKQPMIELTVKNGTNETVSRAYFEGTISSPGRSVPWHKDTFNYEIQGGIEPGETATWELAPNMFSDWSKVNPPKNAVFTVTVQQLDDPGGNSIYSTRTFTEHDQKRLAELKERYRVN